MQRRHLTALLAVAALALTAGCVGALGQPGDGAADANRTVTVTGTGDVAADADQAVVRVSVAARGDTAEAARERLAANVSDLRAALADASVSEDAITTSGYDIGPADRDGSVRPGRPAEAGYVARQSFAVTLSDTDRAGEIVDVAVGSGATQVEGVQFTLSEDARDDVRDEALTEAMEAARDDARILAAAENRSVGEVIHITNTDVRPTPYAAEFAASGDGGGTTIDGGPVQVSATVEVVYELE